MTTKEAIWTLENGAWWDSLGDDMSDADKNPLFDALDTAISALRAQQQAEANEPLTLDELRKMEGEPVWCEIRIKGKPPFYGIVHGENVTGFIPGDDKPVNLAITHVGAYGLAWLAYRHKPEESQT